jgi:hypothetical protein
VVTAKKGLARRHAMIHHLIPHTHWDTMVPPLSGFRAPPGEMVDGLLALLERGRTSRIPARRTDGAAGDYLAIRPERRAGV